MARYGLVVGVAKYKTPLGSLSKTEGDAKAVADVLRRYGDFDDVQILTGEVTREALEGALSRLLLERADRQEVLIYYAGHAVVVKGNFGKKRGYLALSNTTLKTTNGEITGIDNGIALDDLSSLSGEATLSNLVMLLDCCHSETLLEETQAFLQKAIVTQAFADFKKDYFLVSACRKFGESYAMRSEDHSIFTGALLRSLAREQVNKRGVVNASKMYGYISEQLRGTGQEAVDLGFGGGSIRMVDYRAVATEEPTTESIPSSSTLNTEPPIAKVWVKKEDAIAQLQTWIADPAVTTIGIQGLGGVGKSALAAYLYNQFKDAGDRVVSSPSPPSRFWADVSQKPDFVAFSEGVITGLGGKITQPGDVNLMVNQLIRCLNQQPCLLVVDNLETLLTEAEEWEDSAYEQFFSCWVQQGSNSTLLLTTREKPISFQGWEYWYCLEGLKPKEGVKLLQELKIKGGEAELETFAQSVDGHPLTLRLVAGFLREYCGSELKQVDKLGLAQEELIFQEVSGLHHERMNARISWIIDQHLQRLTPKEHQFLLNLTVYRQPFDWEAAAWMWGDEEIQPTVKPFTILKELTKLRNRSLLLGIGGSRYQFQFLIQRYLQQIHIRQYLQQQGTSLTFAHQKALNYYLSHLKSEPWDSLDDVSGYLEAFHHHCQLRQYAQAYEILNRCHTFLDLRGYYQKLVEMYGTLVREWQPESSEDRANWAWAGNRCGSAYFSMGEYRSAIERYQQAQQIFCDICNRRGEATALRGLGFADNGLGEYRQAIKLFQRCLGIAREIGERREWMISLRGLGNAYFSLAEYGQAIRFYEKSLKIAKEIGDRKGEASALSGLGNAYHSLGEYRRAIDFYQQWLAIAREIGHRKGEANSLGNLGNAYHCLGEYRQAIDFHHKQLEIAREIGDRKGEANSLGNLGNAYHCLGEYRQAIDFHQKQLEIAREIGDRNGEANSSNNLGHAYSVLGEYQQAINLLQQSMRISREIGNRYSEADALTRLGKTYSSLGQSQQAIEFHQQSLKIAQEIGQRDVEADAYCGLGDAYRSLDRYSEARDCYQQSLNITREINYCRGEADASFNLGLTLAKLDFPSEAAAAFQNARQLYQKMGLEAKVRDCDS